MKGKSCCSLLLAFVFAFVSCVGGIMPTQVYAEQASNLAIEQGEQNTLSPSMIVSDSAVVTNTAVATIEPTQAPTGTWADLKLIFTTDLHGQVNVNNYETGQTVKEGSIARAFTKIQEERGKVAQGNSFLFDVGDAMYDYSTDYIYDYDDTAVQPIFQAMATMNYDAITTGNHEYEYGLAYMVQQYQDSGLTPKCVVSNVTDANTGKHIWNENMIIERTVTASNGETFNVKVGVIGETIPTLSKKRFNYLGVLATEDIVANATREAQALKAQGADLVVCLAHSGIGVDNPEPMAENVAYALTQVSDIDVVLCGHLHRNFPSGENTRADFYTVPGIDMNTGLVNGKNLIMAASRGTYIGVADLRLKRTETGTQIINRVSNVVKAGEDTAIDNTYNTGFMGKWQQILLANCSCILGEIANNANYQNYFGLLEDNSGVQLVNNAKMAFALNYINTQEKEYKDCPIIGATSYTQSGLDDAYDYYDLQGDFLQSYMSRLEKYKTALYLYRATGAQLKEWLEWSASAYATTNGTLQISDDLTSVKQNVLNPDWENAWDSFYIFDGVEYTIHTNVEPRYDKEGNLIHATNRVSNVTINGVAIDDNANYIVAGDRFSLDYPAVLAIKNQKITSTHERCQNIVKEYIEHSSMNGTLKNLTDDNWDIDFTADTNYVVKSGAKSKTESEKKPWITKYLGEKDQYLYYQADFSKKEKTDTVGPNIVLASMNTVVTDKDVTVQVRANDKSGVAHLKYTLGKYGTNSEVWSYAADVSSNAFTCSENGIYTVLAIDGNGNRRVAYIRLTNINKSILEAPYVDTYTNRKTKITGTAHAGAQIYFEVASGKVYSTKVSSDGTFSYKLPPQKAGTTVYVYVIDTKGRTSASTEVIVKRTGPNKPTLTTLKSNSTKVTGKLNDTYVYPVLMTDEGKAYVQEGYLDFYKNSELGESANSVEEVPVTVNEETQAFTMELPKQLSGGTVVTLQTIDVLYRLSLEKNGTVDQKAPNKPSLVEDRVPNNTRKIKVYNGEKCKICVVSDGKIYTSSKATFVQAVKKYKYTVNVPKNNTRKLKIYAVNDKGKSKKLTVTKQEVIPYAPRITSKSAGSHTIKGYVYFIGKDRKKTTKGASRTKLYATIKGKKKKYKIKESGNFVIKNGGIVKGAKVTIWASNCNGKGFKTTVTIK